MLLERQESSSAPRLAVPAAAAIPATRWVWIAFAALSAVALIYALAYPTQPQYDSAYSLLWGREIADGVAPTVDSYRAPTEHPLLLGLSIALGPLGETGGRILVVICALSVVALAGAAYRLGRVAAGALAGAVAAGLIASRLNLWLLASIGFVDVVYIALVGWAAALEAERPRRGGIVWVLLALGGLLRPEAWLLAGLYAIWIGWPGQLRGVVRAALRAAPGPLLWMAVDLSLTGNPLFSLQHTDALALELQRERPLQDLPWLTLRQLEEIVKLPVLLAAGGGIVAAIAMRRRELVLPGVLCVTTIATYEVIAAGGLPGVYRYLLNAGTGMAILAAFGLAGWTRLPRSSPWRARWAAAGAALFALGAGWTATHTSFANADAILEQRVRLRDDLRDALSTRAALRARACGPISVPNHKLVPEVRALFDLPDGAVIARSDRSRAPRRRGAAVVVDRRIERLPWVNVHEVPRDGGALLQVPSAGFRLLGGNASFAVYGAC